ncbi:MAG: hypothetical protein ACFFBI_03805 [Promethearchaeota archaeon]
MIFSVTSIVISFVLSFVSIIYINLNRENYGSILNIILSIILYLFLGMVFLPLFALSTVNYLTTNIALMLWKISIISWVFSISILSTIQEVVIEAKKVIPLPSIFYALIGGIIVCLILFSDSILIKQGSGNSYFYIFNNSLILVLLILYNLIIFTYMWLNLITNFSNFRDKIVGKNLALLTLNFTILILIYSFHLIFQNLIFRYLYIIIYLIGAFLACYNIFKNPALFIELTNKIFDFIIFHKSGILLYSYSFETGKETDESLLKGSILIGINHILSNFIDKKDQLRLIKMKERDIIFEYDNLHGYAILLTTNNKNSYIEKSVSNFMQKFTELNEVKLKDMTGLIDISEFKNAKTLISEFFAPYIIE